MTGLAVLEYQGSQGEVGDGFFTCWEPHGPPAAPATRHWNRDCGLFPRVRIATDLSILFDDIPPHRRYLNATWFLTVLLGPPALIGLSVVAIGWIVGGFRSGSPKGGGPGQNISGKAPQPAHSELPAQSHVEAWLHRLPRRWARNAAIGGALLVVLPMAPMLPNGTAIALMAVWLGLIMLCIAGAGYLCGRWAGSSLRASFLLSPASALARITPNWVTGAILLGALVLASDVLFGWRKTIPLFQTGISFGDLGYLVGFFGSWMLSGYVTALMSKRGLRKAISTDRQRKAEPESPSVSYCLPARASRRSRRDYRPPTERCRGCRSSILSRQSQ